MPLTDLKTKIYLKLRRNSQGEDYYAYKAEKYFNQYFNKYPQSHVDIRYNNNPA